MRSRRASNVAVSDLPGVGDTSDHPARGSAPRRRLDLRRPHPAQLARRAGRCGARCAGARHRQRRSASATDAIVFLSAAAGAFIVLGAVPMGWLADRYRRGPIIGVSSLVFTAMRVRVGPGHERVHVLLGPVRRRDRQVQHRSGAGLDARRHLPDQRPWPARRRRSASPVACWRDRSARCWSGRSPATAGGAEGWRWAYYLLGLPVLICRRRRVLPAASRIRGRWEKADVLGEVPAGEQRRHGHAAPISIEAAFARLTVDQARCGR